MAALRFEETRNSRESLFMKLYQEAFPLVARHVSKMGGSFDEAKDIFQDALIAYYEKVQVSGLELKYSDKAYVFGIAKYLWIKHYHLNGSHISIDLPELTSLESNNLADEEYEEISTQKLLSLLQRSGQKCMELLSAFYYEKLDMKVLAERFGFSSPRSATVQKFKCLEKVKNTVKEKSLKYEDIVG